MTTRKYTSLSQQTTLTGTVTSGATIFPVNSASSLLGGITLAANEVFGIVIDPDTALEEIVDLTSTSGNPVSANNLTVVRGVDGSSPQGHSAGAIVRHMIIGRDLREPNTHANTSLAVHGLAATSYLVGTIETQTLYNKTLISPILTGTVENDAGIVFQGTTIDAYTTTLNVVDPTANRVIIFPNTSGTVVLDTAAQTLTNKTITSPVITGIPTPSVSTDPANKAYVDAVAGSATAAAASATAAATSATSAAVSATSSANSATASAASAASALTSASSAATSATSAAASATTASNSASTATTQASNAVTSASSAATSATSAAASATAATTSANSASTSASSAAASATASATSASSSLTSANSAAVSAASSATSASSSLATYNTYKTYYLGSFASAPTLDNQGNALITGATYFNSGSSVMYVYTGSAWAAISISTGVATVSGTAGTITSSGGSNPVLTLATAGTAGTYGYPTSVTTDAYGRVTSITAGSAPSGYTAPILGSTTLTSGATVLTVAGLTKITSTQHTQLDGNGYEMNLLLLNLAGAI